MQWNLSMSESFYQFRRLHSKKLLTLGSHPNDDVDEQSHETEHHEDTLINAATQGLNVTTLASRFATNTQCEILKTKDVELIKLQKLEEPGFSTDLCYSTASHLFVLVFVEAAKYQALLPKSTLNLPSSTRTVRALSEVEAFALRAEDLKFVANQFRRLHSKKLQHTFRFYSYHWRTWAACFIQAAWRRIKKRRMQWNLSMSESSYRPDDDVDEQSHETEHHEDTSLNAATQGLNVTILASRFATNTRRGILKTKDVELIKLQKPEEPGFSTDLCYSTASHCIFYCMTM
ncbi:probable cyclic nucleotide-gated ion channel 14 [Tanacetum coccineum]